MTSTKSNDDDDNVNDNTNLDLTASLSDLYHRFIFPLKEQKTVLSRYRGALIADPQMFNRRGPIGELAILACPLDLGHEQVLEAWKAVVPLVPQLWPLIPAQKDFWVPRPRPPPPPTTTPTRPDESAALALDLLLARLSKSVETWIGSIACPLPRENPHGIPHLSFGTLTLGREFLLSGLGELDKVIKNLESSYQRDKVPLVHSDDMLTPDLVTYHPDLMQLYILTTTSSTTTTLPTTRRRRPFDVISSRRSEPEPEPERPRIVVAPICVLSARTDLGQASQIQEDVWAYFCLAYRTSRVVSENSGNETNNGAAAPGDIVIVCCGAPRPSESLERATWDWWAVSCNVGIRTASIHAHHNPALVESEPPLPE